MTILVSFGNANWKASDNKANSTVATAISLYGFRYTATRRTISQVDRDLAVNVGSFAVLGADECDIAVKVPKEPWLRNGWLRNAQ